MSTNSSIAGLTGRKLKSRQNVDNPELGEPGSRKFPAPENRSQEATVESEHFIHDAQVDRHQIQELIHVTTDVNSLIQSTKLATIFLNLDYEIRLFTPETQKFFHLLQTDVGRDLRDFKQIVVDECLDEDLESVMTIGKTIERQITDVCGNTYLRRASVYSSSGGETAGVTLTFVDVTELTLASTELAHSEKRLKLIYDHSPTALWVIDLAQVATQIQSLIKSGISNLGKHFSERPDIVSQLSAKMNVVDVNSRAVTLLGATSQDEACERLSDVISKGRLREHLTQAFVEFSQNQVEFCSETTFDVLHAETDHLLVSWALPGLRDTPCLAYVSAIDFSDRQKAQAVLRQSENRQRALIDAVDRTGVGMRVIDQQGHVRYRNELIASLLSSSEEAGLESLVTPERRVLLANQLRAVSSKSTGEMLSDRLALQDGRTLELVAVPYQDVDGSACRLEMLKDISGEQQAIEAQRIAATTFETQQALLLLNPAGAIIRANRAFCELTGYKSDELTDQSVEILHEPTWEMLSCATKLETSRASRYWQGEVSCQRKDGSVFLTSCWASVVLGANEKPTHFVVAYTDITEQKAAQAKILQLAYYDPLTELPNRRLLLDRLEKRLSAREYGYGALIFIDLDKFKELNDSQGHDAGDMLLKEVAKLLKGSIREGDTVARFGGDEFVVLLDDLSGDQHKAALAAEAVAEHLRERLTTPFDRPTLKFSGGGSLGITLFRGKSESIETLLKQADLALYQAKQAGRHSIRFYNSRMQAKVTHRIDLEQSMRTALSVGQLVLFYQSQIDRSGDIVGAEALIRWQRPEHGLIGPGEFIEEAEESGLIVPLGKWVLTTACMQLACWSRYEATKDLVLSVNISPRQFRHADFTRSVREILDKTGASPDRLKFEITENFLLDDMDSAIAHMNELRELGVRFAIDDFGTGYSSLWYLKQLPVDNLKIDRRFVRDLSANPESAAIVRAIIAMGHTLNMQVTAEGVETYDQVVFLTEQGCDLFQGFYFGHPVAGTTELLFAGTRSALPGVGPLRLHAEPPGNLVTHH